MSPNQERLWKSMPVTNMEWAQELANAQQKCSHAREVMKYIKASPYGNDPQCMQNLNADFTRIRETADEAHKKICRLMELDEDSCLAMRLENGKVMISMLIDEARRDRAVIHIDLKDD